MKLNLLLLSATAMVSVATATNHVELGEAGEYAILAQTGISTVPPSAITGDIAVWPNVAASITGFDLSRVDDKYSTSTQLTGMAYAADYITPTPEDLIAAVSSMLTAYNDAASRPTTLPTPEKSYLNLKAGLIAGETLTPGVYTFGTSVSITDHIYFDANNDPNAIFIIQVSGSVLQAAGTEVKLLNGAKAENIVWQVAGGVQVGAGAHMEGVLLVKTLAAFITGSSLNGRILAQTAVTLDSVKIN
jgi:hypothetical protein